MICLFRMESTTQFANHALARLLLDLGLANADAGLVIFQGMIVPERFHNSPMGKLRTRALMQET